MVQLKESLSVSSSKSNGVSIPYGTIKSVYAGYSGCGKI